MSGGADSTALLIGLHRVAPELGLRVAAGHLHHGLRGDEADGDRDFVRALCASLRVLLVDARWNTRLRMSLRRLSGEAGLRVLRREFLAAAARRAGAIAIATAHTADDQLETVLMRLFRGTGLRGLGGMRPRSGRWIKPLLEATRADVENDLRGAGQSWREDSSNADPRFTRNRVRRIVIPALVEAFGGAGPEGRRSTERGALARRASRAAQTVREADWALERWTDFAFSNECHVRGGDIALDSRRIRFYPLAIQRSVLSRIWRMVSPSGPDLTRRHVDALARLLEGPGGRIIRLPGGRRAIRDRQEVRIGADSDHPIQEPLVLRVPGRIRRARLGLTTRWLAGPGAARRLARKGEAEEWFGIEGLRGMLEVRSGRADERFVPFGRSRAVRLRDFLRRQPLSGESRQNPDVLADEGGILWVLGVRRSARAPVTPTSRKVLCVRSERHD